MKIYILLDLDRCVKDSIVGIYSNLELANKAQENYENLRAKIGSNCIIIEENVII